MTKNPSSDATLPKGIHRSWKLPDKSLGDLWDSIVMDEAIKKQLLSQAIVNFTVRPKVERTVLPLHGVILLVGPPGMFNKALGFSDLAASFWPLLIAALVIVGAAIALVKKQET